MKKQLKGRLTLSFGAVLMGVCYAFSLIRGDESLNELSAMLIAAGIHELGHILAARLLRLPICAMRLDILGARISTLAPMSYLQEWALSAGGPLFNLISAAVLFPFLSSQNEWIYFFIFSSLGLATINLLPIDTFDGARMLYCTLALFSEGDAPARVVRFLSFVFVFLIWLISVYLLLRVGNSLTLFIFSACLFSRLICGEERESDLHKKA